jgi:O-antigen ligase
VDSDGAQRSGAWRVAPERAERGGYLLDTLRRIGWRLTFAVILAWLAAFPLRALFTSDSVPTILKVVWPAFAVLASVRPHWSPRLLVAIVPLLPFLPLLNSSLPAGIVHLFVASQAVPFMLRGVMGRQIPPRDGAVAAWGLVVVVAILSMATRLATYRLGVGGDAEFWREVGFEASRHLFEWPGSLIAPMFVAVSTLLDGFLVVLVVRTLVTPAEWRPTLKVLAAVAVVVGAVGIVQSWVPVGLHPMWALFDPGIVRINATYTDPNALAAYFALVLPVVVGWAAASAGRSRWAWLLGSAVIVVALVMSGGRMGLLAAAVGVAVLVVRGLVWHLEAGDPWDVVRRHGRRIALWSAVGGAAVVVILVLAGTALDVRHHAQTSYLRVWLYTFNLRQPPDDIAKGRLVLWKTTASMVRDHPVFGVGTGRVFDEYAQYRTAERFDPRIRLSAHSTFLQFAAELGVVGLAAWLLLLAIVFHQAFSASVLRARDPSSWLPMGVAAGLMAYAITMLTGDRTILREDVAMFAAVTALAASATPVVRSVVAGRIAVIASLVLLLVLPARVAEARRSLDLTKVTEGLSDWKQDERGRPFRWSMVRAAFYVPPSATTLTLPLRKEAPFPQRVRIIVDGRPADEVQLTSFDWRTFKYAFPQSGARPRFHKVRLEVSPAWRRPYYPTVGVMVGEIGWSVRQR